MNIRMQRILAGLIVMALFLGLAGCSQTPAPTPAPAPTPKIEQVTIAASQGSGSYPLAPLVENNALKDIADKTVIEPWVTSEQLSAMVTSDQAQFAVGPITNFLMLYNKGANVKLVNVAVWGMLYILSADDSVNSIADLKGKTIAVTGGLTSYHGNLLRYILMKNNLDPEKDLTIVNMDMTEASAQMATGGIKLALSNEPNSTITIENAKKGNINVIRAIDLQKEWARAVGDENARIPQAGLIVVGDNAQNHALVTVVRDQYLESAKWINQNPAQAGPLVEKYFPKMKAAAVEKSMPYAGLNPVASSECKEEINAFLTEYLKVAPPASIGGKMPDDGFYY